MTEEATNPPNDAEKYDVAGAIESAAGDYRYTLGRCWSKLAPSGTTVFIMLNPSTADAQSDDPTIRRRVGFAKAWGSSDLLVGNLYAFRATDPRDLFEAADPVGRDNDHYLRQLMNDHSDIVCAWGANAKEERVREFVEAAKTAGVKLWCLGTTKDGAPRHPLYVAQGTELVPWSLPT